MLSRARRVHLGGLLVLMMAVAVGCGGQEADAPAADASHDTDHGDDAVAQSAMTMILASADAADGTEDKVVSKCAGCKLGMPGSADYALTVEGYEMHFCGDNCKSHFADDTQAAVMALKN